MRRALVVDDHPLTRKYVREILLDEGFFKDILEAEDGAEALALLIDDDFDLAVVDVDMPRMDGITLIAEVRAHKPDQSFIVFSGMQREFFSLRLAYFDIPYLEKGCRPEDIAAMVRKVVSRL